jgi:hypothetical protein
MAEGYPAGGGSYNWIQPAVSFRNWLWDVIWAANLYVAVGDRATVMTSGNGVDWALEAVPDTVTTRFFLASAEIRTCS